MSYDTIFTNIYRVRNEEQLVAEIGPPQSVLHTYLQIISTQYPTYINKGGLLWCSC